MTNPRDLIQKALPNDENEHINKPLRRKAGSGARPTTQRNDTASSSKRGALNPIQQKIGAGSFLAAK